MTSVLFFFLFCSVAIYRQLLIKGGYNTLNKCGKFSVQYASFSTAFLNADFSSNLIENFRP